MRNFLLSIGLGLGESLHLILRVIKKVVWTRFSGVEISRPKSL
jgi:hypothetical protein